MFRMYMLTLWFLLGCGIGQVISAPGEKGFSLIHPGLQEADAAPCVVTSTDDDGNGTLRHCITVANATAGTTITFGIATAPDSHDGVGNSWWRIAVVSPLPALVGDNTVIDGTTQPGNTNSKGPDIEVYGGSAPPGTDGVTVTDAKGVTIRGLAVNGFKTGRGIVITGAGADGNRVQGNYVGTDPTGTRAVGNYDGVTIFHAGTGNIIGGTAAGQGNIISGNGHEGIWISNTPGSVVKGNYIGANADGTAIPNGLDGIRLQNAPETTIGGASRGARNVIPARNYMAGCRTSPSLSVNTSVNELPVEVLGSVEVFALLVNARVVDLPEGDIRIQGHGIDDVIEMKGSELDSPLVFHADMRSPETVSSWALHISDLQGNALRSIKGGGPPPSTIAWDGRTDQDAVLKGGELYQYQLEAEYSDGSRLASPVRLFGAARTSAVSIVLGSGAFSPDSAQLSGKSKHILKEAAVGLRKYPKERIIVEGHADAAGSAGLNRELARKRTESTVSYLINEEKIPAERIVTRLSGSNAAILHDTAAATGKPDAWIEVKGEFEEEGRPEILDHHRTAPFVKINNSSVPVNDLGRFSHRIEETCGRVELEMRDVQGRSVWTLMPLPTVELHVPCQGAYVPFTSTTGKNGNGPRSSDHNGNAEVAQARHAVKGKTDAGNTLKINGQDVKVEHDGSFTLALPVKEGENVYALEIANPAGYTHHVTLVVRAVLEKARQRPQKDRGDDEPQLTRTARSGEQ